MTQTDLMGKSSSKKKDKKANLSTAELAALANSLGTVTPSQPGVRVILIGASLAGAEATPKRLVFAPGCLLIDSPNIEKQTSTAPVLQGLQDLVTVLCGFLVKDGFVNGSKSDEVQEWQS